MGIRGTRWGLKGAICAWLLAGTPALAYPTSLIFTPTGDVVGQGAGCLSFYNAFYGNAVDCWTGYNVGVLPSIPYGSTGLTFPGLEVGLDVLASPGRAVAIKPTANVKLGLLAEEGPWPALAAGYMSAALLHPRNSLNLAYVSGTHAVTLGGSRLGRFTFGGAYALPGDPEEFEPTWPLPGTNAALLAGYEFPSVGPFSFAVDTITGVSELSGTCLVMNIELVPGTFASVGYAFSHDRTSVSSGLRDAYFLQTYTNFDLVAPFQPAADGEASGTKPE